MPFYDYKCINEDCAHVMIDQLQSFSEKTINCEECGDSSEQQFSGRFAAHGLPNGHNAVRVKN